MLKKFLGDPLLIVPTDYEEILVQILGHQVRKLRIKEVALVKVIWRNQFIEVVTWEAEKDMKNKYPHLVESRENRYQGIKFSS